MTVLNELLKLFPKEKGDVGLVDDNRAAYRLGKRDGYNKALSACTARVNEMRRKVRKFQKSNK